MAVLRAMGGIAAALMLAAPAMAGDGVRSTPGYVINMLHVATAYAQSNCPEGLNPLSDEFFKRELRRLGYPPAQVEHLMRDFPNGDYIPITTMRGRIDGKLVNIYANPTAQPDPNIRMVRGTKGYGFNLDGRDGPNDFVDPESHERGVDNQFFRAVGCVQNFAANPPDLPIYAFGQWDLTRDTAPAWLIQIHGPDVLKDGDEVTVVIDQASDTIIRDASGGAARDMTFRINPDSRSHNKVRGTVKNGVVWTEFFDFHFVSDPKLMPTFDFKKARMRLIPKADGTMDAFLGGYLPWYPMYWTYAQAGWVIEHAAGFDLPGIYYALHKSADFDPDPKTGANRGISVAYRIEAVPALIMGSGEKVAGKKPSVVAEADRH